MAALKVTKNFLVLTNCQTEGQKNSFSLMMPDTEITSCDIWGFNRDIDDWKERLPSFSMVITNREMTATYPEIFSDLKRVVCFPNLFFRAMHPDLCHVYLGDAALIGPLHEYHSAIVFAAFKSGLKAENVSELFCYENFITLGFFDLWNSEKQGLLDRGKQEGVDLRAAFLRWTRKGEPFMHSFNHPKINVIYDTAREIALSREWPIRESPHRPHDSLAMSAVFPVYPEIASRLGLSGGSYSFKPTAVYKTLNLLEFIHLSYENYSQHDADALTCSSPHYDAAIKLLAEVK